MHSLPRRSMFAVMMATRRSTCWWSVGIFAGESSPRH